jgi:hypothetical protein
VRLCLKSQDLTSSKCDLDFEAKWPRDSAGSFASCWEKLRKLMISGRKLLKFSHGTNIAACLGENSGGAAVRERLGL